MRQPEAKSRPSLLPSVAQLIFGRSGEGHENPPAPTTASSTAAPAAPAAGRRSTQTHHLSHAVIATSTKLIKGTPAFAWKIARGLTSPFRVDRAVMGAILAPFAAFDKFVFAPVNRLDKANRRVTEQSFGWMNAPSAPLAYVDAAAGRIAHQLFLPPQRLSREGVPRHADPRLAGRR